MRRFARTIFPFQEVTKIGFSNPPLPQFLSDKTGSKTNENCPWYWPQPVGTRSTTVFNGPRPNDGSRGGRLTVSNHKHRQSAGRLRSVRGVDFNCALPAQRHMHIYLALGPGIARLRPVFPDGSHGSPGRARRPRNLVEASGCPERCVFGRTFCRRGAVSPANEIFLRRTVPVRPANWSLPRKLLRRMPWPGRS